MVASKDWIAEAAEVFVEEVGEQTAVKVVARLQKIPAANKSVENTLIRLRTALRERNLPEGS